MKSMNSYAYLDILFEGRNKEYGAYPIRKTYQQRMLLSGLIATLLCLLLVAIWQYQPRNERVKVEEIITSPVALADIPINQDIILPPPPPKPPVAPPVKKQIKHTVIDIVPNDQLLIEDLPQLIDDIGDAAIGAISLDGSDADNAIDPNLNAYSHGTGSGSVIKSTTTTTSAPDIYRVVEIMPEFPGGERALIRYLQNNVIYPTEARRSQIQGVAQVEFVVQADGSVTNVKITRDPGGGTGEEAKRVVEKMPKWKPGKQNNKAVPVYFSIPVNFTLH